MAGGKGDRQVAGGLIVPERYRDAHVRGLDGSCARARARCSNSRVELLALHRDGSEFPSR